MHNITPGAEKIASHTKRKNLTGQPKELDGLTNKKKVAVHAKNGTTHTHRRAEKKNLNINLGSVVVLCVFCSHF